MVKPWGSEEEVEEEEEQALSSTHKDREIARSYSCNPRPAPPL
jgi:hypothetical protein